MRFSVAAAALMLVATQFASVRAEAPNAAAPQPPSPQMDRPQVDRRAAKSTEELKKKVEEVGFKDVEIIPHMFVVLAKKPDGQSVSMIVDADTLQALQLGGDGPDQGGDEPQQGPQGACKGPVSEPL